jgi:hypothetical protein
MIYHHEIVEMVPGMLDEYTDVCELFLMQLYKRYGKPVGFFNNACRHRENVLIWELGEEPISIDNMSGLVTDRDGQAYHRLAIKYRHDWYDSFLESVPFSPTVDEIIRRQKKGDFSGNTLYYWESTRVLPGKMDEFLEAMEKELVPMEDKRGMKLAGCYRWFGACGRSSEVISLWAVGNWAQWGKIHRNRLKDRAFKKWMVKAWDWRGEWSYKFLTPTRISTLH